MNAKKLLKEIDDRANYYLTRMNQTYGGCYEKSWDSVRVEELRWLQSRVALLLAEAEEAR